MSKIIILEIQYDLVTSHIEEKIMKVSKFYDVFGNKIIAFLLEKAMNDSGIYDMITVGGNKVEVYLLNQFARSRLIKNFEITNPELTFTLLGCSEESKLIKVWKKDVKRKRR